MGNYCINIDDDAVNAIYRLAMVENTPVLRSVVVTPYTEPDTEQVREESYQRGYSAGKVDAYDEDTKKITKWIKKSEEAYQKGLDDAWEAARKIGYSLKTSIVTEIFGTPYSSQIFSDTSATEVIEKIRQYEQGKDRDERVAILIQGLQDNFGYTVDEIAAVLAKMKES